MNIFFSEGPSQYSDYTFNYAVYAIPTENNETEIYSKGFLPYTGIETEDPHFYLCRSLRVNLKNYSQSSENRRIFKKLQRDKLVQEYIKPQELIGSEGFNFCLNFANQRFGENAMDAARLEYILRWHPSLSILQLRYESDLMGYIFLIVLDNVVHYWYAFYDVNFNIKVPLGKYMMTYLVDESAKMSKDFIYLGTCYQTKSLYKARDFKGMEFFDGQQWNDSIKVLKTWCQEDELNQDTLTDKYKKELIRL